MGHNVLWFDHDIFEDHSGEPMGHSKTNEYEVKMTHALVRHIVRQGAYGSKDIAVLTPYVGQLQKLRAAMNRDFEVVVSERDEEELLRNGLTEQEIEKELGTKAVERKKMSDLLRIATVDNFQGEEAKVVIISLVRSNSQGKVGFLRTTNRINVLLSRAQHGMYLIGNSKTYGDIPMWNQVITILREKDCLKTKFNLQCPRHSEQNMDVSTPEDFDLLSPEGGCQKPCDKRLDPCGHQCLAKCHSDTLHRAFWCPQPCARVQPKCGHACPGVCGDPCAKCMVIIENVTLPCGHVHNLMCYETQLLDTVKCPSIVTKVRTFCGHTFQVACHQDVNAPDFFCQTPCSAPLTCGHACPGYCSQCKKQDVRVDAPVHQRCTQRCGRKHSTCSHYCGKLCHDGSDCGSCDHPCEVRCDHSKCGLNCCDPCAPCIEKCTWRCEHQGDCFLPCAAACERLPCDKRCSDVLSCGHQCPGICGEPCPAGLCQLCSDKGDARVDLIEFRTYKEIDPNETPIIALGCGHFFTAESLDGHFGISEHYQINRDGKITGIKRRLGAAIGQHVPRCPDCATPVAQHATNRYKRILNQRVMDESIKKTIENGERRLGELGADLNNFDNKLQELSDQKGLTFVAGCNGLASDLQRSKDRLTAFLRFVSDENQPVRRLYDATIRAIQKKLSLEDKLERLSLTDIPGRCPDQRIVLACTALLLRLNGQAIELDLKKLKTLNATLEVAPKWTLSDPEGFFNACERFLDDGAAQAFPKIQVEVSLYYGHAARWVQTNYINNNMAKADRSVQARQYLAKAAELCGKGFSNSENLLTAVEALNKLLETERYEAITPEEFQAIKAAMVSGPRGLNTHSGHWYNCENGHPVSIFFIVESSLMLALLLT